MAISPQDARARTVAVLEVWFKDNFAVGTWRIVIS